MQLQPDDPQAQHNLAVSYFLLHRLDEGIRCCRRALKLKPDYPLALYNLALAHMHLGQTARARRYAARAVTAAPGDENIRRLSRQLGAGNFWSRLRRRLTSPPRQSPPIDPYGRPAPLARTPVTARKPPPVIVVTEPLNDRTLKYLAEHGELRRVAIAGPAPAHRPGRRPDRADLHAGGRGAAGASRRG